MASPWTPAQPANAGRSWLLTVVTQESVAHVFYDGTALRPAELLGWWNGTTTRPVELAGYWDGGTVKPLA
jgi:hypothetical protein